MTNKPIIRGLYAIADTAVIAPGTLEREVELAILGGARLIQYRDKRGDRGRREYECAALARLCAKYGVLFIVNDDPELASSSGAPGVHLGRDDWDIPAARRCLGAERIIGISCYNQLDRARKAQDAGADYVAFGSFYPSRTKPRNVRATVELLRAARKALRIPIVAIGGITPENGAALLTSGADALAAIDGVFSQHDVRAAARRYAELFPPTDPPVVPEEK